jgi:hypothetical protein
MSRLVRHDRKGYIGGKMPMNRHVSAAEFIARRILAWEADECDPSQAHAAARAVEKLRLYLTKSLGTVTFQSLFMRAVVVAQSQSPWLWSIPVILDSPVLGFDEAAQIHDAEDARKAGLAILTQLLDALITFVGYTMVLRILQAVWSTRSANVSVGTTEWTG